MIATLVLALSLAQPAAVTATTPDKAAARALLREGTRLFDKGQHEAALERFTRAHALYPSPKLLYNIAQANRELGRKVEALAAFEGFLAQVEKPPARLAAEVRRSVAELQAQLAELQIRVDVTGAELQLDGTPLGLAPLPDSVWVTPGAHRDRGAQAWLPPGAQDHRGPRGRRRTAGHHAGAAGERGGAWPGTGWAGRGRADLQAAMVLAGGGRRGRCRHRRGRGVDRRWREAGGQTP